MSDIVNVVFSKGVLFDITIGKWSAIKLMTPEDLLLGKVDKKAMHVGHKKLLPEETMAPIVRLEGEIRSLVAKKSTPFPVSGAVFMNYKALPGMLKSLHKLIQKFDMAKAALLSEYQGAMQKQLAVLGETAWGIAVTHLAGLVPGTDQYNAKKAELDAWYIEQMQKNMNLYPTMEALAAKYYVDYRMFKVNPLEGSEQMSGLEADEILAQQEALKKDLEKWVKEQAVLVHKNVGEKAAAAHALLAKQGKLHPKNVKALFDAIETFVSVDLAGSAFQKIVAELKDKYLVTDSEGDAMYGATAEKVESGKDAFASLLNEVGKLASNEVAQQAAKESLAQSDFHRIVEL